MSSVSVPVAFVFLHSFCFTWRSWILSVFLVGFLHWLFEYFWQVDAYPFLPLNPSYGPWFQTDVLEISRWFVSFLFSLHLALFTFFSYHILSRYFFIWESCAASAIICVEKPTYLYDKAATTMYILLIYVTTATESCKNVSLFGSALWHSDKKLGERSLCAAAMELGLN